MSQAPRLPLIVLLLCVALPAVASDDVVGSGSQAIINGEPDDDPEIRSVGMLVTRSDYYGYPSILAGCTGTLIAPDVVLTAAHCLDDPLGGPGAEIYFSFEQDLSWLSVEMGNELPDGAIPAMHNLQHPDYDPAVWYEEEVDGLAQFDDLAIVFLGQEVDREHAWLIDEGEFEQIEQDTEVEIVGYGRRDYDYWGGDPELSSKRYRADSFVNEIDQWEMQIGGDGDEGRKCYGDSGGPTFARIATNRISDLRTIGVTSHIYDPDLLCEVGGVDTRIDAYWDWIEDELEQACGEGMRAWCDVSGIPRPSVRPVEEDDEGGAGCDRPQAGCGPRLNNDGASAAVLFVVAPAGLLGWRRRR